jgi:hypothetical protein
MKKTLSLVLSLILLVSLASLSFAAVTFGGNLRVWYQATTDESNTTTTQYANGFRFDRLALTVASDLSPIDGFKGEVQFKTLRSGDSTSTTKYISD